MSRKCILVRANKLNWEAEQEVVIEAIGPFDNWDSAGECREYLGEPLSNEYVIVKLKSAVSKQKELDLGEMPSKVAEEEKPKFKVYVWDGSEWDLTATTLDQVFETLEGNGYKVEELNEKTGKYE